MIKRLHFARWQRFRLATTIYFRTHRLVLGVWDGAFHGEECLESGRFNPKRRVRRCCSDMAACLQGGEDSDSPIRGPCVVCSSRSTHASRAGPVKPTHKEPWDKRGPSQQLGSRP